MRSGPRSRLRPLLACLALIPAAGSALATPQNATAAPAPVYARLVELLDARFLKPGAPVLLEVKAAWQNGSCKLRAGSTLRGRVVEANASSRSDRTSRVAVVVEEAECNGPTLVPLPLTVAAVVAAGSGGTHKSAPQDAEPGLLASGIDPGLLPIRAAGMAGLQGPAAPSSAQIFFSQTSARSLESPARISAGDAIGFPGLKLSVGTGPEASTVLSAKGRNVSLQRETEMVLVPSALVARKPTPGPAGSSSSAAAATATVAAATTTATAAASSGATAGAESARTKPPEAEPEVEVCAAPSCSMALPDASAETHGEKSVSLRELGYAPRAGVQLEDFDHEAALAYLGEQQLLVSFNLHRLVERKEGAGVARTVRAAVLDAATLRVLRMVDWPIADRRQYLWPAGEGRVLAHVGDELRVYGPDLKVERRIELPGPLAWVRVSPAQKTFAVGVILERHSRELHAQLAASEEPEEDMEIRVLDAGLETTMTAIRSSRAMPPALTDEGEVEMERLKNDRWRLVEHGWDGQAHAIASVASACVPQLSSLAPDLLFAATCGRTGGAKYRVLRRDGRPVLQGSLSSKELGQSAHGSPAGTAFVVGIAEAERTIAPGGYFFPSELKTELLTVYRATDGRRMLAVHVDSPTPTREAYALAPDAGALAILSAQQVSVYRLPAQ